MSRFTIKERSRRLPLGLTCLVIVLGCLAFAPGAGAKPRATVSWSLPGAVNEGAPIPFSWTAKRVGRNYRLVIQRPFGTARVWKSIKRLPTTTGSAELPGLGLGVHRFRIAALRGRRLLATRVSQVAVFGTVQFTTLLENESPSVFTAPGNSFAYVAKWNALWDGLYFDGALFGVRNNNCSSVHIAFLMDGVPESSASGSETITVVQESRNAVSGSAPFKAVGSVDAELTPGQTWGVTASYTPAANDDVDIYINGYAICYSKEPFSE